MQVCLSIPSRSSSSKVKAYRNICLLKKTLKSKKSRINGQAAK
jgi:hypothetical protein